MFTGFKGAAKRLDAVDLPRIGAEIGVGEDELRAFMDVEAAGAGFDRQGRLKMLFEPHVFFRELGPGKKRDRAVAEKLAYQKWRSSGYPVDSYPRLMAAMAIDETAALRSASWGLGQIMGFNCRAAGYSTPQRMIAAFAEDEENQVRAIVAFLKSKKLDAALRARDWLTIERVYNGGGFNGAYAARMRKAFERWQKVKDTPAPAAKEEAELPPKPQLPADEAKPPVPEQEALLVKRKPVLRHRRVWTGVLGWLGGGGAVAFGSFAGFDWTALLVLLAFISIWVLVFLLLYRKEIRAGMFSAESGK